MTRTSDPTAAHAFCSHNRAAVESSDECGCFYCCQTFWASSVWEYTVEGPAGNALCPRCGIDSVLPDACVELSPALLTDMERIWFDA